MIREERRRTSALIGDAQRLSAAIEPLADVVLALVPGGRLTVLAFDGQDAAVVLGTGSEPLEVGIEIHDERMHALRDRICDNTKPLVVDVDRTGLDSASLAILEEHEFRRLFIAPLFCMDHAFACVVLDQPRERIELPPRDCDLLGAVFSQARGALENSELREQAARRQRMLEAIARMGAAFTSVLDLGQTAAQIVEYASLLLELPAFALLFRPQGANDFRVLAAEGLPAEIEGMHLGPIELSVLDSDTLDTTGGPAEASLGGLFTALREAGLHAILSTQLVVGEGVLRGVLVGLDRRKRQPDKDEREAFDLLAMQATNAIWNAERYEAEVHAQQRASEELATTRLLLEAANTITGSGEPDSVRARVVDIMLRASAHSRVAVCVLEEDRARIYFASNSAGQLAWTERNESWQDFSEVVKSGLRDRRSIIVDYDAMPESERGASASFGARLVLYVPLVVGQRLLGYIALDTADERIPFSQREIAIAEGIAFEAAVAFDNARLLGAERQAQRDLREQLDRMAVVNAVAAAAATSTSISEVANRVLEALLSATGFQAGIAHSYDEAGRCLVLLGSYGVPESQLESVSTIRVDRDGRSDVVRAVVEGRPIEVDSRVMSPGITGGFPRTSLGDRIKTLALPITAKGRVSGTLWIASNLEGRFSQSERALFRAVAEIVGQAIENARFLESERATARANDALARIDQSIHSTLDRNEVLQRVAVESAEAIGADSTVLAVREGTRWVVRYAYNGREGLIGEAFEAEQTAFVRQAMMTERPVSLDELQDEHWLRIETQRFFSAEALMIAPLIVRDQVIGGLFFGYRRPHFFTSQEREYALRLGTSVGLALVNIELYEAERDIADRLQDALLLLPDDLPGVRFAHSYHSASEAARVGGDFYDLFELGQDLVGITIGDVAGKGLDAAILTSLVKNAIRAHASDVGASPARVLTRANDVVFRQTPHEVFVTVFFAMLDRSDGRLIYANAGHTSAVIIRAEGVNAFLHATGPLLGAFQEVAYKQSDAFLDPQDVLFLYTDGLTEARRQGELLGEERLFELLWGMRRQEPAETVRSVIEEVLDFSGGQLNDDLALLAIQRLQAENGVPRQERLPI